MARKRTPCDFCEAEYYETAANGQNEVILEFYPENGLLSVHGFLVPEDGETQEMELNYNVEYCPFCGRKLDLI